MSISSIFKHIKSKTKFHIFVVLQISLGSVIGGMVGARIFLVAKRFSNPNIITPIQNSILVLLLILNLIYIYFISSKIHFFVKNYIIIVFVGVTLELLGSFLGIGGGPIMLHC